MDDMFIIHNDKKFLKQLLIEITDILIELKLACHPYKTHIVKLTKGFTFLQIKYNINNNKIIKRPTRQKIVRERRRIKKHKYLLDKGDIKKEDICNWYKSWRTTIKIDCNRCHKTLINLDKLFYQLFTQSTLNVKPLQMEVVNEIFKEAHYEDYRYQRRRDIS